MGVAAKEVGLRILKVVLINGIGYLCWLGIKNKINGKTVTGKKKDPKKETYVDWKGNIVLGTQDGWVA